MTDFQKARINMVDGQIHTAGVIIPAILAAFEAIPREIFVPNALQGISYTDEDLNVAPGRILLEPQIHARMVQALDLKPSDVVLDIGGSTGYSAAILSSMVTTVVALEDDQQFIDRATKLWNDLDLCNIVPLLGTLSAGSAKHAPFDSIVINGAVAVVPDALLQQLAENGRLIAVVKEKDATMGHVTLIRRLGEKSFSSVVLMSAGTPYMAGFEPETTFKL